jgi:hypothetical protein
MRFSHHQGPNPFILTESQVAGSTTDAAHGIAYQATGFEMTPAASAAASASQLTASNGIRDYHGLTATDTQLPNRRTANASQLYSGYNTDQLHTHLHIQPFSATVKGAENVEAKLGAPRDDTHSSFSMG